MLETAAQMAELQRLIDATLSWANAHMVGIVARERRLTARRVAFATVTPRAEPRFSPLDSLFIHGRSTMGTGGGAARIRNLRANPACSAT
jgi:hypothetical protein